MVTNIFSKAKSIVVRSLQTGVFDYCVDYCSRPTTLIVILFLILSAVVSSRAEVLLISLTLFIYMCVSAYYYVYTASAARTLFLDIQMNEPLSRSFIITSFLPGSISQSIYKGQFFARWLCFGIIVLAFGAGLVLDIPFVDIISLCTLVSVLLLVVDVPLFIAYLSSVTMRRMHTSNSDKESLLLNHVLIYLYLVVGICVASTLALLGIALPLIFTPAFVAFILLCVYVFVPLLFSSGYSGYMDTPSYFGPHSINTRSFLGLPISSRSFFFVLISASLLIVTFFMTKLHSGYAHALGAAHLLSLFLIWFGYVCVFRPNVSWEQVVPSRTEVSNKWVRAILVILDIFDFVIPWKSVIFSRRQWLQTALFIFIVILQALVLYISFFKNAFHIHAPSVGYWIASLFLATFASVSFYIYRWLVRHFHTYHPHYNSVDISKK